MESLIGRLAKCHRKKPLITARFHHICNPLDVGRQAVKRFGVTHCLRDEFFIFCRRTATQQRSGNYDYPLPHEIFLAQIGRNGRACIAPLRLCAFVVNSIPEGPQIQKNPLKILQLSCSNGCALTVQVARNQFDVASRDTDS
jgi:hypothetical protein